MLQPLSEVVRPIQKSLNKSNVVVDLRMEKLDDGNSEKINVLFRSELIINFRD